MEYRKNIKSGKVCMAAAFGASFYTSEWEASTEKEYNAYIKPIDRMLELRRLLSDTDYQSSKAFEGVPSDDWDDIKKQREAWRVELRDLEA